MDFIFNESLFLLEFIGDLTIVVALVGGALFIMEALLAKKASRRLHKPSVAFAAAIALVGVATSGWLFTGSVTGAEELQVQRIGEIEELYGVELTEDEYRELYAPNSKPLKAFRAYGETSVAELNGQTVVLTWSDGKFWLYDAASGLPLE